MSFGEAVGRGQTSDWGRVPPSSAPSILTTAPNLSIFVTEQQKNSLVVLQCRCLINKFVVPRTGGPKRTLVAMV